MFQRDKELRAAGGADRARVLEKAKAERQARAAHRERDLAAQRLQRFVRARCAVRRARDAQRRDLDAKLADIARLKALLQRASLALPLDVVFELACKLLFCYSARADDQSRLAALSQLFRDALAGGGEAATAISDAQLTAARRWQLTWLVDMCLQASECGGGSGSGGDAPVALAQQLVDTFAAVREHVASRGVRVFSAREWQYARMEKVSLMKLVRRQLAPVASAVVSHGSAGSGGDSGRRLFCAQLVDFAIHVTTQSSALELPFVETVLSVPILPDVVDDAAVVTRLTTAPLWGRIVHATRSSSLLELPAPFTPGIPSITWLLGNLLWLSDRVSPAQQSSTSMLDEVQMFTKLLQRVPAETFAPSGVAVSWTKVSDSHSIPVVFPDTLNDQLRVLVKERRVRQICDALITFNPAGLRKPLATERPTPMHPTAPTIHEQYGFGDIASSRSLQQSFSETWRRVKSLGRASWAKKLLEKSGLKKARESSESVSGARKSSLMNTSALSRQLAEGDATSKLASARRPPSERAFDLQSVYAVTQFFATFLARWPHHAKHNQVYQSASMNVINVLSFYKVSVPTTGSFSEEDGSVHLVTVLWSVLQEVKDFEAFAQDANLLHVDPNDGYIATLTLFCATYSHLLAVLDDEEMYDQEFPLPLHQLERIVVGFKHALHSAYWVYGLLPSQPGKSLESGMFLVDTATRLLTDLYSRCSRLPFCNASSWVLPGLDSAQLIDEVLAGTPRANKLISSMPFVVSFPERVKLFHRLVEADKKTHQGDASNGTALAAYRVRIRRGAVLEDGLTKLNVIRGNLKKKINVVFVNAAGREEVGIDAGGLFKEFWLDLANLAFDLQYGLFLTTPNDQLLYPNPHAASAHFTRESDHLTLFQFVGRILGKALYEGIVVQPKFAQFFLSKLLHSFNHLSDLPSLDPEIYKNLMFLKSYDGDVEDLGLTFTVVQELFGEQREIELLPNGAEVAVTNANRTRYVHLVANYYLNTQIRDQSAAFRAGLADLIDIRWLQLFNEPELQVLISGKSGDIDVPDLKAHTKYAGGYYALDKRVQWLWQALESFSPSERAAFLRFSTSCQRAPSLGFGALTPPFCIQKIPIRRDDELLPSSSTCFNTLKLPTYSSYRVLRAKLLVSISSGAGFEMT